ncbi:MAG: hypothetical protein JW708_09155 [Vallitaleaceae bacterium]|nr:hypothetical protein [Vallitaleaceae bacterium]
MTYLFGIDGGGTKTQCVIGNEKGEILGEGRGGAANYQTCGIDTTKESIEKALNQALAQVGIEKEELEFGIIGLAGADEASDLEILLPLCKEIFKGIEHEVVNDTWIGLRSASPFGVISICGTGGAHAAMNPRGDQAILRNLDFILGNRGGGGEVVEKALHFSFRSEEGTYQKSELEKRMPLLFGVNSMGEVCDCIRKEGVPESIAYNIPIEVMRLAHEGDPVCKEIIEEMSRTEGEYAASLVRKLKMEEEELPLVLIGSLFKTKSPLMIEPYLKKVQETAKKAYCVIPEIDPVMGAFYLALDRRR